MSVRRCLAREVWPRMGMCLRLSFEKWLSKWLRVVSPVSRISCYMYVPFGSMLNLIVWSEWIKNLYLYERLCFMLTVYNYDKLKWKIWSVSPQDRNLSFKADINCFSVPIKFYCLFKAARQFGRFYHHFDPSVIWEFCQTLAGPRPVRESLPMLLKITDVSIFTALPRCGKIPTPFFSKLAFLCCTFKF